MSLEAKQLIDTTISRAMKNEIYSPFALALLNYDIHIVDHIEMSKDPGAVVLYEQKKIYIAKESGIVKKALPNIPSWENLSDNQKSPVVRYIAFVLFHEISHPLLLHGKRQNGRDPFIWNLAGDYIINLLLKLIAQDQLESYGSRSGNSYSKPEFYLEFTPELEHEICIEDMFEGLLEEEVYEILANNSKRESNTISFNSDDMQKSLDNGEPCKSQDPNDIPDDKRIDITTETLTVEYNGKTFQTSQTVVNQPKPQPSQNSEGDGESDNKDSNGNIKPSEAQYEQDIQFARSQMKQSLMKGCQSAALKKFLGKLFNVKIDWGPILRDSIATLLEPSAEVEWGLPTPEWLANPFDLPYMPEQSVEEKRGIAVFLRDQSGSMTDHDVQRAASIVWDAREHYIGLLVVDHDYDNTEVMYFESTKNMDQSDIDKLANRNCCGGTSHKWALEEVNKFMRENPGMEVSIIIGVTDLCSDLESSQYVVDTSIPRVWLVNSDYKVHGLLGRVIRLKD